MFHNLFGVKSQSSFSEQTHSLSCWHYMCQFCASNTAGMSIRCVTIFIKCNILANRYTPVHAAIVCWSCNVAPVMYFLHCWNQNHPGFVVANGIWQVLSTAHITRAIHCSSISAFAVTFFCITGEMVALAGAFLLRYMISLLFLCRICFDCGRSLPWPFCSIRYIFTPVPLRFRSFHS